MEFNTGDTGTNNQGLSYVVVCGKVSKKTLIRFDLDNAEVRTTKAYLRNGLPNHPTYGKIFVGNELFDKNGDRVVVIEKLARPGMFLVKYDDGVTVSRDSTTLRSGKGHHPTKFIPVPGQVFETQSFGNVTVVEYKSATDVRVKFEDGVEVKVPLARLKTGSIGHPYSGLDLNKKYTSKSGWTLTISKYHDPRKVDIIWQDGSTDTVYPSEIKLGSARPLNKPSVAGIGFFGTGKYTPGGYKSGIQVPKHIYAYWTRMIIRCYNPLEMMKNGSRHYVYVNVCKDWLNFQNFAEWALSQPNHDMDYDLEKDLLGDSLEYSPENCCFVPTKINAFLTENQTSVNGLPIGVNYIKPGSHGAKDGYIARCHVDGVRKYLGYYDDPISAYAAYKAEKESYARSLAEEFKDTITQRAYDKLSNYTLDAVYPTKRELSDEDLKQKIKEKMIANGILTKE